MRTRPTNIRASARSASVRTRGRTHHEKEHALRRSMRKACGLTWTVKARRYPTRVGKEEAP